MIEVTGNVWEDVKPVIDFLPDNVHVIDLPEVVE